MVKKPELSYITQQEEAFIKNFAPYINENNVIEITEQLQSVIRQITQNANPRIVFYDMALQFIILIKK